VRVVLQRVLQASVIVIAEDGREQEVARIGPGLVALVGFAGGETPDDLDWMAGKIAGLRVFGPRGEFDLPVDEVAGEVLVVSQFTLLADLRKGRRPDLAGAAPADAARALYDDFVRRLAARCRRVRQGAFGARMRVTLENDGPVTFLLERGGAA
jgi:D-tyrosyl-tRNA(Tyr) deacylase